jgi:thioredoxin reductase
MNDEHADLVVVGAGPAGLAAAIEARRRGIGRVVVLDRESSPGGIPRHTRHSGFGVRDLRRVLTGPRYAERYAELAQAAGAEIRIGTMVTQWPSADLLSSTSPAGVTTWSARAILLATGCRERPRTARLVPGDRPAGILTTGALQQFADLYHLPIGRRAVVVGAEHVSFSAVHTLLAHGVGVAAVITEHSRPQSYAPLQAVTTGRHRVPVYPSTDVTGISGRRRVERVTLLNRSTGQSWTIDCDTIVFTGDWIPDHELARAGGLLMDAGTRGPSVDQLARTTRAGVFAAGNLTHAAETADVAALAGRHAGQAISQYLRTGGWPDASVPIRCDDELSWIYPQRLAVGDGAPPRGRLITRARRFHGSGHLEVVQDGRLLYREAKRRLIPNRSVTLRAQWLHKASPDGGPIDVIWT